MKSEVNGGLAPVEANKDPYRSLRKGVLRLGKKIWGHKPPPPPKADWEGGKPIQISGEGFRGAGNPLGAQKLPAQFKTAAPPPRRRVPSDI